MSFGLKVYVVTQVYPGGVEEFVDVKLTFDAARAVAKLDGGRRVRKRLATKLPYPEADLDSASSLYAGRGVSNGRQRSTSE